MYSHYSEIVTVKKHDPAFLSTDLTNQKSSKPEEELKIMADEPNEVEIALALAPQDGIRGRNKKLREQDMEAGADLFDKDDELLDKQAATSGNGSESVSHVQAVRNWWAMLRLHFGDSLLLQIFFVYFTQGIRSTLCSLGTSYYLNETLALPPAQSEALRATAAIPWIIKPVYGMLSDSVPIWGTRRKSYLLIFSAISALAYFSLAVPGLITKYVVSKLSVL